MAGDGETVPLTAPGGEGHIQGDSEDPEAAGGGQSDNRSSGFRKIAVCAVLIVIVTVVFVVIGVETAEDPQTQCAHALAGIGPLTMVFSCCLFFSRGKAAPCPGCSSAMNCGKRMESGNVACAAVVLCVLGLILTLAAITLALPEPDSDHSTPPPFP